MKATTTDKTRLEDWQDRRQYFESLGCENPLHRMQIKVLDYLINRYRDSAAAHQPARFFLRPDFYWNSRRIAVHHHLARGKVAGVQNTQDAEQRVVKIVQRLMSGEPIEDEEDTTSNLAETPEQEMMKRKQIPTSLSDFANFTYENLGLPAVFLVARWKIKRGLNADRQLKEVLAKDAILPESCLKHLVSRLTDPTREDKVALNLFLKCRNRNIIERAVRVWRDRVTQGRSTGLITDTLEAWLLHPWNQSIAAEWIRVRLADDDAEVRIAACRLIEKIGDLDDIGLLSDLLALPHSDDEDPSERDAITAAMKAIAEIKKVPGTFY